MKIFIIANWKMNPQTFAEAKALFDSAQNKIENIKNVEIVICPSFIYISKIQDTIYPVGEQAPYGASKIHLGGQDCFYEESGAFTGEISPTMLKNIGCDYVILGHSERRKYQKETDKVINKKIKAALKAELNPILCVDKMSQVKNCLKDISKEKIKNIIIAFEPLSAIGTGNYCDSKKAEKMRSLIEKEVGKEIPVLYGGSVNSQNTNDYIEKTGFQGLLIGSASLNPKEFIKIIENIDLISKN